MKRLLFFACIFSIVQTTTFAQNKHKVFLLIGSEKQMNNFSLRDIHINDFISKYGIGYEYTINQKFSIYGSYSCWLSIDWRGSSIKSLPKEESKKRSVLNKNQYDYDKIIFQQEYNFINLGISYALFQKKAHEINAQGGLILAFGK